MEIGPFIIRIVVGILLVGHGSQKLFGRLGGYGLRGTGGYLEGLGLRPGRLFAALAGTAELVGGILFAVGFLTPVAALLIAVTMLVAARTDHAGKGLWIFNGGAEYVLTVTAVVVAVTIIGPGSPSVDRLIGLEVDGVLVGFLTLVLATLAAASVLALRRRGAGGSGSDAMTDAGHEAMADGESSAMTDAGPGGMRQAP